MAQEPAGEVRTAPSRALCTHCNLNCSSAAAAPDALAAVASPAPWHTPSYCGSDPTTCAPLTPAKPRRRQRQLISHGWAPRHFLN